MSKDLYEVLGVSRDATPAEIKKAYRKLSMENHPDRGGDEDIQKQIVHAMQVLKDPDRRAHYDKTGQDHAQFDNRIESLLTELIVELMGEQYNDRDIVKAGMDNLDGAILGMSSEIGQLNIKLGRMVSRLGRVQHATGESLFDVAINAQITHLTQQINQKQMIIDDCKAVKVLLAEYRDTRVPPPSPTFQDPFLGGLGSSFGGFKNWNR